MTNPPAPQRILFLLALLFTAVCAFVPIADAQSLPELSAPSNPLNGGGFPRGNDGIPVSSGMLSPFLPKIPNLEFGFQYYFGNNVRTGRFSADYVLPVHLSLDSVAFGEAHAEGWGFWKRPSGASNNRIDLSFGGGYRTMLGDNTFVGVNGFYDTSRLFNRWYASGGMGVEFAANVGGDDAVDLNLNWYGNLFSRSGLVNAFRNKGNSFDVEAGYSHALFDQAMDLRLKVIGYQFDIGSPVRGWRGGADLTTRDGMFTLRYEHGSDPLNGRYDTVGGFVAVGFQLENLLSGASPFSLPEPVFTSPRDLRRLLGLKVKRNWSQPAAVVLSKSGPPGDVWFRVDCQGPGNPSHILTGLPAVGDSATLDMTYYRVDYDTYSINFGGDTATLPPTVPVTVTFSNSYFPDFHWEREHDGSSGSFTVDVPRSGGTIGDGGSIFSTYGYGLPVLASFDSTALGTVIFEAPGVRTLTITVTGTDRP
jgi:hypothetical protein